MKSTVSGEEKNKYTIGQTIYMVTKVKGSLIPKYTPVSYVGETVAGNHYVYINFARMVKSLTDKQISTTNLESLSK